MFANNVNKITTLHNLHANYEILQLIFVFYILSLKILVNNVVKIIYFQMIKKYAIHKFRIVYNMIKSPLNV